MDTGSCVSEVERFVSRRDAPSVSLSDNDTTFIGAVKELPERIEEWNKLNIAEELAQKYVQWRFNPPLLPFYDGIWESFVRSFKRVLYSNLGERRLIDEVLNTTFCPRQYALNSRPLTLASIKPSTWVAITINHFLLGNKANLFSSTTAVDEFDHRKWYAKAISAGWLRCHTTAEQPLSIGCLFWIIEDSLDNNLKVVLVDLSLPHYKNYATVSTATPAPPSCASCLVRPFARSLNFFQS